MQTTRIDQCVACGSKNYFVSEEYKGYQLATCADCKLTFTLNPDYQHERYIAAYEASYQHELPVSEDHAYVYESPEKRLLLETLSFFTPPPWLTSAERIALQWIKRHAPPGATIIDCGCGTGRFLRALKKAGFRGVGVELSQRLVNMLRKAGLEAIHGAAPTFEWRDSPPFAITFFEVLEHIPEPMQVIKPLRERFPNTSIIASVPSPFKPGLKRGLTDYPPNHFLRWTPQSLELFFGRAGYTHVTVIRPGLAGSEVVPGLATLALSILKKKGKKNLSNFMSTPNHEISPTVRSKLGSTLILWLHRGYQLFMDVIMAPKAWYYRRKGYSGKLLVIARP